MPAASRWRSVYRFLRWPEKLVLVLLAAYLVIRFTLPASGYGTLLQIFLTLAATISGIRLVRFGIRKAIWRLRNRLLVTYLFIAVVPIVLILAMAATSAYLLVGQVAVYMASTELERRTAAMAGPVLGLAVTPRHLRTDRIRWMAPYLEVTYPGVEIIVSGGGEWRYPENSAIELPRVRWSGNEGIVWRDGQLFLWAYGSSGGTKTFATAPLTPEFLNSLVPDLGDVAFVDVEVTSAGTSIRISNDNPLRIRRELLPPASNRFDLLVTWFTVVPVSSWDSPAPGGAKALRVTTRFSSVLRTLFAQKLSISEDIWWTLLLLAAALFVVAELVSLVVGVTMTRTITGAVHGLYEGTQRVMEGDFSHRIEVSGGDQLAKVGRSFNQMTENLERLVALETERQRLQSELEIAREVQNQLYPKTVPPSRHLELTALCHPARTVSGDYYDYLSIQDSKIAMAIGDVAGKGISAALLMATVQASLRTQIRACLDSAGGAGAGYDVVPAARLVSQLNQQLFAYTLPEKFATFYFGIYDEQTGVLTYTNAGHPPPILVRGGEALRLETTGMVVGAFPFAEYGESQIDLLSGDLLVCFTDGITEPENEYGEMFGEEGLIDLLVKNAWRKPADIIASVIAAVKQWNKSPESQDDMTLLLARRV